MRHCTKCGEDRPDSEFYKGQKNRLCKKHYCEYAAAYRRRYQKDPKNRERLRAHARKWQYGITEFEYNRLLDTQGFRCAICGTAECEDTRRFRLAVDHCHTTGRIRGLLCNTCNRGIGFFKDDVGVLAKAIAYLS